ncbi:MAG: ABC transporter ATP-binding protein [Jatrophihabitans sp.]
MTTTVTAGIAVRCADLGHTYQLDGEDVVALDDVHLDAPAGIRLAVLGPSGSGKSTLSNILAGLRRPSRGQVWVGDDDLTAMTERQLLRWRGQRIGIVLQNPSRTLLPYGTAEDNILFARRGARTTGLPSPQLLLEQLGLADLAGQPVARLSGGEQQRLAVGVAMSRQPPLLLADEPTSQLDSSNRDRLVTLLVRVNAQLGTTLIVVTHDPAVADAMQQHITLADGRTIDQASHQ